MMRTLISITILVLITSVVATPQNTSNVFMTANRPRVLAWIGDYWHSPVYIRESLSQALAAENMPVTFIENTAALNADSLRNVQILIMLGDGGPKGSMRSGGSTTGPRVPWMTEQQQKAIWDFVESGGGWLALHNVEALYPPDGLYYKLLGGVFVRHPKPYLYTVRVVNKDHPVTAGVDDYQIFDEHHMIKYNLPDDHLLTRSISEDNTVSVSGWWNEQGKGRLVYFAPGHTREALMHPMTQKLMRNALKWVSRTE